MRRHLGFLTETDRGKDDPFQGDGQSTSAVEVIPPADNEVDALAMQGLLGSLGLQAPAALEIAAGAGGRRFIVRARQSALTYLCAQLESVYGQVEFRPLEENDPARRLRAVGLIEGLEQDGRKAAMGEMHLRCTEALPLRTCQEGDFQDADPILGVLGGLGRVQEGERVLSQLVLRPAPDDWADRFQSLTRPADMRMRAESPLGLGGGLLLALAGGLGIAGGLRVVTWAMLGRWIPAALLSLALAPLGWLAARFFRSFERKNKADPEQVKRKIFLPGFRFRLRLAVEAPTEVQARRRLKQMAAAYRQFNTGAGNALTLKETIFDPCDLSLDGDELQRLVPGQSRDIINTAEVASLWHLPWGEGADMVERSLAPRRLPLPADVSEGVPIGTSSHHGQKIPVSLPPSAVNRNKLFVAKTRKGKSTLMLHLARAALQDPRQAVVFIDPHGDAVKKLLRLVPEDRVDDVVYLDFGAGARVPGWNLLDTKMGFSPELLVESFIYTGRRIWTDFWGPRMEDVVRHVLWSLVRANQKRGRDKQYTVLDIQAALILKNLQHRIRIQSADDMETKMWWGAYYDGLHHRQRLEVINPVLTKIQRFASSPSVRRVIARPASTIDVLDLIERGGILLVNLPGGEIGMDNVGFLGSVLLSYLEVAIRANQSLPPERRPQVTCFIDECGSIPFDYQKLLAELVKMGADFTLVTQSLRQLEDLKEGMLDTTLANVDTLGVFQTSGRDARELVWELGDEKVEPRHIVNLPDHTLYLKTQREGKPLPVMRVKLRRVPEGDEDVVEVIQEQSVRYTLDVRTAKKEYRERAEDIYGTSLEKYEKQLRHWQAAFQKAEEEEEEIEEAKERNRRVDQELKAAGEDGTKGGSLSPGQPGVLRMPDDMEEEQDDGGKRKKHTRSRIMD